MIDGYRLAKSNVAIGVLQNPDLGVNTSAP